MCKQMECDRSYRDLNGLCKHLLSNHLTNENKSMHMSSLPNTNVTSQVFNNSKVSDKNNMPDAIISSDCDNNIDLILGNFILKLYGNNSLNRGIVQQFMTYSH
ncbi:unnamed protein product, partial [Psylliodes chrysocephalus]